MTEITEQIYHYTHSIPEYRPTKFDIVDGPPNTSIADYTGAAQEYLSGQSLEFELDFDDDPAVVIGGSDYNKGPTGASTVDQQLLQLFAKTDPKTLLLQPRKMQSNKLYSADTSDNIRNYPAVDNYASDNDSSDGELFVEYFVDDTDGDDSIDSTNIMNYLEK